MLVDIITAEAVGPSAVLMSISIVYFPIEIAWHCFSKIPVPLKAGYLGAKTRISRLVTMK